MLRLRGLGLAYSGPEGPVSAFSGVDAELGRGEIAALVGPSGCGKTSLVRVLSGLRSPTSGSVELGAGPGGRSTRIAVIFQDYGLLPWKTVSANVELPLLLYRRSGARRADARFGARARRERAAALLEELGLSAFARYYPARLSGGMRQRVALARALIQEPDILLMDEPFSSLDALTREAMQETLLELQRARKTTVLLVTHSIEEAAYLSDAAFVMRGRNPGRVVARLSSPGLPSARSSGFRSSPEYLEYMSSIRRELEGLS
jgi:ABC-type nitrate/sulfonate/bicarbonate transport system, ATPase component